MSKKHSWKAIDNVILKDGLLTVDFKNNKLFQRDIDNELHEEKFNNWCKLHLS